MSDREWTAPERGWYQFGGATPEVMGCFLDGVMNPGHQPGPPYVHAFVPDEPEAVITRAWWFFYDVSIRQGPIRWQGSGGWLCFGRRHAGSKARRELRRHSRVPYSYTITS